MKYLLILGTIRGINDVASEIDVPVILDDVTGFSPYSFFAIVLVEKQVNSDFPVQIEMFTEKNVPLWSISIIVGDPISVHIAKVLVIPLICAQNTKKKRK